MLIRNVLKQYCLREDGAVALMVALFLTVLLAFLAVGIDLGSLYFQQKTLQTKADMTAISAALNLGSDPDNKAQATVIGNGLDAAALSQLNYGRYVYDRTVPASDRFEVRSLSETDVNATEVLLRARAPLFFSQTFVSGDSTPLAASATAARFDFASFSLGSRLLSLNEGLLNAMLSEALGSTVSLSVLDYQSLADTDVDLLTFTDALEIRAGLTALDYSDILNSDVELGDIAGALLDTGLVSGPTTALTTVTNSVTAPVVNMSKLIEIGGNNIVLQLEDRLGEISVSALDLLMTSVEIINADHYIETHLDLGVPNVLGAELDLIVGERESHSGWITLDEKGATLHTAQVRMKLELDLSPTLLSGLGAGVSVLSLKIPLYLEIASATVTLFDLYCDAQQEDDIVAVFDTGFNPLSGPPGTHVLEAFIGTIDDDTFNDVNTPLNPDTLSPVNFLDLKLSLVLITIDLFTLQLKSHAATGISTQPQTDFLASEIGMTKTFGSGSLLESTVSSLLAPESTEISISSQSQSLIGGLIALLLAPVVALVNSVLNVLPDLLQTSLLAPIDAAIDAVLELLGIGIGEADLTLEGVACGKVVLVR